MLPSILFFVLSRQFTTIFFKMTEFFLPHLENDAIRWYYVIMFQLTMKFPAFEINGGSSP